MNADSLLLGVTWYVVFLLSTTCHEAAHALAAKLGGDLTAFHGGQVSLDPVPHIRREPFGMVVFPILSLLVGGWMMGWASVPYDPFWAQRHPRRVPEETFEFQPPPGVKEIPRPPGSAVLAARCLSGNFINADLGHWLRPCARFSTAIRFEKRRGTSSAISVAIPVRTRRSAARAGVKLKRKREHSVYAARPPAPILLAAQFPTQARYLETAAALG
jgi:hypothetical protein